MFNELKRVRSEKYKVLIYKHVMVMNCSGFSIYFGQQYRNLVRDVIGDEQLTPTIFIVTINTSKTYK